MPRPARAESAPGVAESEQPVASGPGRVPDHARPRADWARVAPLAPVVSAPPITFDGERFGRSVPGARPLTTSHRVHSGRTAPSGVMLDVAKVESVVSPAGDGDVVLTDAADGAGVLPATPGIVHRKASPGRSGVQRLVTSDFEGEFPAADLRQPPTPPTTWTPDEGFVESPLPDDAAPGMRVIRRRPPLGAGTPDAGEGHDASDADDDEVDGGEPEQRAPVVRFVPVAGERRLSPPPDLVDVIEQVTGVHVGDTVIDRSPAVTERAEEMGAVAFTERGVVHLPPELGPIDDPAVRSVAAHELVHVAQHRLREGDIPSEDSSEGRELEAQARAVQRSVAPGAPVVPTFIRSETSRPVRRDVAPVGVQRLASQVSEYEGTDYSEIDFSHVEPRSSEDIFAWQERDGEPSDVPWSDRQDWAERFEETNSPRLQRLRDDSFRTMFSQAGPSVTDEQVAGMRQRLDSDMPYQFGGPFGVDPYPDLDLPEPSGGAPSGGGGRTGPSRGGGSRTLPVVQPTALEQAESDASRRELAALATASRARIAAGPAGDVDTFEQAMARLRGRLDLERNTRKALLEEKREAAEKVKAPDTHIVALTQDEIDEIRELVDAELPVDGGSEFLPEDDHTSVSMAGVFGGFVTAAAAGALARHARAPGSGRTGGTGGSTTSRSTSSSSSSSAGGGTAPGTDEDEDPSQADKVLRNMENVGANRAPDGVWDITADQLMVMMRRRLDQETKLRQDLLKAKKTDLGENLARLPDDYRVTLTRAEMNTIREAIDRSWPVIVGEGLYLGDDQYASLGLTSDDDWGPAIDDPESVEDAIERRMRAEGRQPDEAPATETAPAAAASTSTAAGAAATNGEAGGTSAATAPPAPPMAATATAEADADEVDGATAGAATNVVESLSEIDLDRLTRRLWTRMRRELRSELLIDRERAGVLADMR